MLVPVIIAVDRSLPFSERQITGRAVTHIGLASIFAVVSVYIFVVLEAILHIAPWSRLLSGTLLTAAIQKIFWSMLVYCLIVGIWEAYLY